MCGTLSCVVTGHSVPGFMRQPLSYYPHKVTHLCHIRVLRFDSRKYSVEETPFHDTLTRELVPGQTAAAYRNPLGTVWCSVPTDVHSDSGQCPPCPRCMRGLLSCLAAFRC